MLRVGIQNLLKPLKGKKLRAMLRILGISKKEWDELYNDACNIVKDILGLNEVLLTCISSFYFDPLKYTRLLEKVIHKKWNEWYDIWRSKPSYKCLPHSRLRTLIESAKVGDIEEWVETLDHVRKCEHCARLCVWFLQKNPHLCKDDCASCEVKVMCPEHF